MWAEVRNSLGIALEKQGDLGGAIVEYRRIIAKQPDFFKARFNLGLALERLWLISRGLWPYTGS